MTWLATLPSIAVAAAVLFVPGLLVLAVLGVRGWRLAGAAAPVGTSVIAVASVLGPFVGLRWSLLPVGAVTAIALVAAIVVRLAILGAPIVRPRRVISLRALVGLVAVLLPAVLIGARLILAVPDTTSFAGTFDNVFHLNAIRFILDTGTASPLDIGLVTAPPGAQTLYPSAWHAIASLVAMTGSVEPTVATNAVTLVVAAIVWPLGAVSMTAEVVGRRPAIIVAAGLVSAAFNGFPLRLTIYGSLFPLMLGYALVAPAAAAAWALLRAVARRERAQIVLLSILLVLLIPGLAVSHPDALILFLTAATAAIGTRLIFAAVRRRSGRRLLWVVLAGAAALAWFAVLQLFRPPREALTWQATDSIAQGIGRGLTGAFGTAELAVPLSAVVIVSVVVAVRRRSPHLLWLVSLHIVLVGLFVVAVGLHSTIGRVLIIGSWYTDIPRLAAVPALTIVPLGALGAVTVWDAARRFLARRTSAVRAGSVLLVLIFAGWTQLDVAPTETRDLAAIFHQPAAVSPDEAALIARLPSDLPPGAVVVANPWTGAALAYALEDVDVYPKHVLYKLDRDQTTIVEHLSEARSASSPTCTAVRRTGTSYVLDFRDRRGYNGVDSRRILPGLAHLGDSPLLTRVDREGDAYLYRITGCGRIG